MYPANPHHTAEELYHADSNKDKDENLICQKSYPDTGGITGGISHVTCVHGITKGFTAMRKGESPGMFTRVLINRLPRRVKAKRRYFIYDNSCNCHKYSLRRYPWRIRNFTFVVDRHHKKNHTVCSGAYDIDRYNDLKSVNSQICEQRNRSLRKFHDRLVHMTFKNYLKFLEVWFAYVNLKTKDIIKQSF